MLLLFTVLCFAMQLVFWLLPNMISSIAMFSAMGFLLGPFFTAVSLRQTGHENRVSYDMV